MLGLLWRAAFHAFGWGVALVGLWVISSLAVHANQPPWLALAAGLVPFAVVPLAAEIVHRRRLATYGEAPHRHGPARRRLVRTALVVNAAVIAVALLAFPARSLDALAMRGDWMLEHAPEDVRERVLRTADVVLERVRRPAPGVFTDPREEEAPAPVAIVAPPPPPPRVQPPPPRVQPADPRAPAPPPSPEPPPPAPPPVVSVQPPPPPSVQPPDAGASSEGRIVEDSENGVPMIVVEGEATAEHAAAEAPHPEAPSDPEAGERHYADWLTDPRPHRLIAAIPTSEETSPAAVARWLADHERDPYERVKAIHDYIAMRVDYEYPFDPSRLPPSDPAAVFTRRRAVCAGYARLFEEMYAAIGGRAVYVSGDARFATESASGSSHAWNGVEIEGRWYLVDVTWDAGTISGGRFVRTYRTDFLLAPPAFFAISHLPAQPRWQLREPPLSRGEFVRQPLLFPSFIAYALKLLEPKRSQITVSGKVEVVLGNPGNHSLIVEHFPKSGSYERRTGCDLKPGAESRATCVLGAPGEYVVYVFAALRGRARHELVAKLEVNSS